LAGELRQNGHTVLMGHVEGFPVGILFFGRPWSEGKMIGMAYAFEQIAQVRILSEIGRHCDRVAVQY